MPMNAQCLDGRQAAKEIRKLLKVRCETLLTQGVAPMLAVVLVGEDPASQIYVRNKERACEKIGIRSLVIRMATETTQAALEEQVCALNLDPAVHGILVQLPLPAHLNETRVINLIDPDKDVDGFHPVNIGRLLTGQPGFIPGTPKGAMALLQQTGISLAGKEAVVVGRSNIVGKPMAILLQQANATVTMCHSRTCDLATHTRRADVLVVAIGRPGMITGNMIKPGAVVIDVGINRVDDQVVGDVDFATANEVAGWITPVPGGVGPMTITMLLENTLEASERALKGV